MGKILIVAEKPAAGKDIAKVVGATEKHTGYMEGERYVVTWAFGHLIGLKDPQEHDERYKKWSLGNLPVAFQLSESLKVLPESAGQFRIIKELIHRRDIDSLINAGDAGREGYLIQEWIYRMAGCRLPKKVLWTSSLTVAGIRDALDHLKENDLPEFQGILREAEARAEGDWILGYNYSPLLTLTRAYKQTLSYGRCQTPLLNLVCQRDQAIRNFKPSPYWTIEVTYAKGFKGTLTDPEAQKAKKITDQTEARQILQELQEKQGMVMGYEKQEKSEKAPLLYNLAKLQQDMGRIYSYSPDETLQIVQTLYEKYKILSYPRTDSQYLSTDIFDEITEHLKSCSFGRFQKLTDKIDLSEITADKSYFNDLKVTDHHALIPTINADMEQAYASLTEPERNVFDAVVMSLIAIFYPPYQYDSTRITVDIGGYSFVSSGTTIRHLGYKEILRQKSRDQELQILPELAEGNAMAVDKIELIDQVTKPPAKYTDATIIKAMEKYDIGTSATRADILIKLQNPQRQFLVRDKGKYSATELGYEYISIVPDRLKSPELTHQFEESLRAVNAGSLSKAEFLESLIGDIRKDIEVFTATAPPDEQRIGYQAAQSRERPLGKCPKCGADVHMGKYGAYCVGKCGMRLGQIRGKKLTEEQVTELLNGRRVFLNGLQKKDGSGTYAAYFVPGGIVPYEYTSPKDGSKKQGYQFQFTMEFEKHKAKTKKGKK